eukprot:g11479.t1
MTHAAPVGFAAEVAQVLDQLGVNTWTAMAGPLELHLLQAKNIHGEQVVYECNEADAYCALRQDGQRSSKPARITLSSDRIPLPCRWLFLYLESFQMERLKPNWSGGHVFSRSHRFPLRPLPAFFGKSGLTVWPSSWRKMATRCIVIVTSLDLRISTSSMKLSCWSAGAKALRSIPASARTESNTSGSTSCISCFKAWASSTLAQAASSAKVHMFPRHLHGSVVTGSYSSGARACLQRAAAKAPGFAWKGSRADGQCSITGEASGHHHGRLMRSPLAGKHQRVPTGGNFDITTLINGMRVAARAVSSALLLVILLNYVFAIVLLMENFGTLGECMYTLIMDGTFMDSTRDVLGSLRTMDNDGLQGWVSISVFLIYVLLTNITVMNMLIGIVCEVVSEVKREDEDGVKPEDVIDLTEYLFEQDEDAGREQEVTRGSLLEVILKIRGGRTISNQDIIDDIRRIVQRQTNMVLREVSYLQRCLTEVVHRTGGMLPSPRPSHRGPAVTVAPPTEVPTAQAST